MVRSFTQSEQAADPVALAEPGCIAAGQRLAEPLIESKRHAAHTDCNARPHSNVLRWRCTPPRSSCAKTVAKQQTWLTTARPMSRVLEPDQGVPTWEQNGRNHGISGAAATR